MLKEDLKLPLLELLLPATAPVLLAFELSPFEEPVMVMLYLFFMLGDELLLMVGFFLGLLRENLTGDGADRDEAVDDTGERRDVTTGSPWSSLSLK